jgi:molecular chaperone GrpE (heat shock protein)
MLQKCAILGLALLLVGGLATAWVYNATRTEQAQRTAPGAKYSLGPEEYLDKYGRWYRLSPQQQNELVLELDKDRQGKTPGQLALEQKARLQADLERLAARQMDPGDIADILYGAGWENEVEQYKKRKEQMEIISIVQIVCLSIGGTLFGFCLLLWMLRLCIRILRALWHRCSKEPTEAESPVAELTDIEVHVPEPEQDPPPPEEPSRLGRRRLTRSQAQGETLESIMDDGFLSPVTAARARMNRSSAMAQEELEDTGVAVLLADEPSPERGWSPENQWSIEGGVAIWGPDETAESHDSSKANPAKGPAPRSETVIDTTLKEQAEDLQRQIAEFKQAAQSVQQTTREQSEPLGSTLKELTQQVSAIREYAACQQDRVEKLQDGYDWGIIRTFCLRVIRCIDNIENRIDDPPKDGPDLIYLEEVRDELLFALESSGVEQFRPDIHSEYRGQEKFAEALKDRVPVQKSEDAGRIAQVVRPGYRYMMDDENYKVVRTAQVKLFG